MDRLGGVLSELRKFVSKREWAQFHDPKNLAMAVASEAGELLAEYRWVSNSAADAWSEDPGNRARVSAEVADVGIALLLLCDRIGVDLVDEIRCKIRVNSVNYPAATARGKASRPSPTRRH